MLNLIYLNIFSLFPFLECNINPETKICEEDGKNYKIGEKFNKNGYPCIICICSTDGKEICNHILSCINLNCGNKYTYEIECCKKFACTGNLILIRNN